MEVLKMGKPTKAKDRGYSLFRSELNEFANICGLPNCAQDNFDRHVEVLVDKYYDKINSGK